MLKQLRIKLAAICVVTTGILLISMAAGQLYISAKKMDSQREETFQSSVNSIIYKLQSSHIIDTAWLSQLEFGNRLIVSIEDNCQPIMFPGSWQPATPREDLIQMAKEKAISSYGFHTEDKPFSVLKADSVSFTLKGAHHDHYQVTLAKAPSNYGWQNLIVLRDVSKDEREKLLMGLLYFFSSLAALSFLFFFSWWFSGKAIRPIEKSRKEQTEFVASASHELKSPLAVIRANLAAVSTLNHEGDLQQRQRFILTADRECIRMSKLIEGLLFLANSDGSAQLVSKEAIEMDTMLTELYEAFIPIARQKKQELLLRLPEYSLPNITGDKLRIEQTLSILADNACAYTPEKGAICISASLQKRWLCLAVSDNGPGIADSMKEQVFLRFFRVDDGRSEKSHYGLGLSIAKEIAELHSGHLALTDTPGGGCTFTLKLPLDSRLG